MINNVLNDLQLYKSKHFSGLVDENMLANALATKPHQVSTVLSYIFGRYENNTLDFLTSGMGKTMTVENRQYEWPVAIEHDKAIRIKDAKWKNAAITSNMTPGIDGTPVQIWVAEKWFGVGAILAFDDRNFQARVMAEPFQDGTDFVYTLNVVGDNPGAFIDPSLLVAGKQDRGQTNG